MEVIIHTTARRLAKKAAEETAIYTRLGLASRGGLSGHINFTCDGCVIPTPMSLLPDFV
jgi:hypothetical protein